MQRKPSSHFIEAMFEGQREEHPQWREQEQSKKEQNDAGIGPAKVAHPHVRQVLLHSWVSHNLERYSEIIFINALKILNSDSCYL